VFQILLQSHQQVAVRLPQVSCRFLQDFYDRQLTCIWMLTSDQPAEADAASLRLLKHQTVALRATEVPYSGPPYSRLCRTILSHGGGTALILYTNLYFVKGTRNIIE
jgi:hypothetical protein